MKRKRTLSGSVFDVINILFFSLYILSIVYIFWNIFVMSISPETENAALNFRFWPKAPQLQSYFEIWTTNKLSKSFVNTVYITVLGTFCHVLLCSMAAYALSRPYFLFKSAIMNMILFSMIIPGQMIMVPLFAVYRGLGLINNLNALVVSGVISGFSIIVMRSFFLGIPASLAESARLDGAGEWGILFRIYLPTSLPGLATITLFQMVAKWNTLFDGVLFINSAEKQPLQVTLRSIVAALTNPLPTGGSGSQMFGKNLQSAAIIISIIPILIAYPFMQRYFVRGILIGSVKE